MSTVTFENGKSVQFDGTPTQADIDEVAAKMNGNAPTSKGLPSLAQIGAGLGKIANNIEQPFVSVAAAPVQLLAKALHQPDPYANNAFPGPNGQGVPVAPATPKGFLQKAGQAGQIGSLILNPTSIGGFALAGGAQGLSQSVANGNTDPGQIAKDTIYGSIFNSFLGVGAKGLSYVGNNEVARTGVEGAVKDAIDNTEPGLLSKYIDASKSHGTTMASLEKPTAVGLAENEFDNRATILTSKVIPAAGKAVGAAKASSAALPIVSVGENGAQSTGVSAVHNISDQINEAMQNMTGHQFTSYGSAEDSGLAIKNYPQGAPTTGMVAPGESGISPLPGRSIDLSPTEQKQLENLDSQLAKLRENPTVQTASDVLVNIDNDIGKWNNPQFGAGNSPVQGVLKFARGAINRAIGPASPEIAAANDTYSKLMDLRDAIAGQAGKEGQSSALMMRRVLSGDKSNSVIPILNQLDQVTAPFRGGDATSLVQHSILSNWSTTLFGDESTKGLLSQAVASGNKLSGESSSIFGYPKQFMKSLVNGALAALSPDPEKYAMALAEGKSYSLNPLIRFLDSAMDKTTSIPIIGAFTKQLKDLGVSASAAEPAAKTLFKIFLMQQLTRPNGYQPPQGAPATLPVNSTISFPDAQQPQSTAAPTTPPLSLSNAKSTASAIKTLTPQTSGQGMSRTLGVSTPGKLNMTTSLTG